MPLTYRIDPEAQMLFVVGKGAITQAERIEAMRAWISDPLFRPGLNTLCDFSAATSTPSLDDLENIVRLIGQHSEAIGRKKTAIVTSQAVTFGVARQFQILAESTPLTVGVFTDMESAVAWLREPRE